TLGTTPTATTGAASKPPAIIPTTAGQKTEEKSDTMKWLDDPVYGLKTEVLSPGDKTLTDASIASDPFETYTVPPEMRDDSKSAQRSNYKRAESDISMDLAANARPAKNTHSPRLEDVPVYTPPEPSPKPVSIRKGASTRNQASAPAQNPT
ncbi:hypothetical protein PFISCL1PPCAC_4452, partial [Pristionchus fissidentatus]